MIPIRISFCIRMTISSLIFHGTGCTKTQFEFRRLKSFERDISLFPRVQTVTDTCLSWDAIDFGKKCQEHPIWNAPSNLVQRKPMKAAMGFSQIFLSGLRQQKQEKTCSRSDVLCETGNINRNNLWAWSAREATGGQNPQTIILKCRCASVSVFAGILDQNFQGFIDSKTCYQTQKCWRFDKFTFWDSNICQMYASCMSWCMWCARGGLTGRSQWR